LRHAYDDAVTAAAAIAVVAAAVAVGAVVASVLVLRKLQARQQVLEREIDRGKEEFDRVVARELEVRSEELSRLLARSRADTLSQLAEEERRIAEERRRDVAERERDATARLGDQVVAAQRAVEQRLANWNNDVSKLQEGLTDELKRVEARQRQRMAELESRIGQDGEGLQNQIEDQRLLIARLRDELAKSAQEVTQQAAAELEQHGAERRRALQDVAERLQARERDLKEIIEREGNEASQRIQIALGDIERRQVEQMQRIINRETTRFSEAASQQFDLTVRTSREESARRLSRELDLAVERFAREAEGVLTERLNQVSDMASKRLEDRLSHLQSGLERGHEEALRSLEERAHQVESGLRERLQEIADDAESERVVLESRLQDVSRRLDEVSARAGD
jgi:hypothetical protein